MKKIAYFDCFAGISGDMILGALLDIGLPRKDLVAMLGKLPLKGYGLEARRVKRGSLRGTKMTVRLDKGAGKRIRGLDDILHILGRSSLPGPVLSGAEGVFRLLARAESRVHGSVPTEAHFHEVGAVDSIVDIVGSLAGLHLLGIEEVYASALPWNSGIVECAHGKLPVPAPAVAELMKGIPVYPHHILGELVTPTGVAILKSRASEFGYLPPMRVSGVGYGAGGDRFRGFPNLLRLVVGEASGETAGESVTVVETEVDDMSPELLAYLTGRLLEEGVLDVYTTPVVMKKGRQGQLLTVLCSPEMAPAVTELILRESTTLGVRFHEEKRVAVSRSVMKVVTPYGRVRVKAARRPGAEIALSPEYDDCVGAARKRGVPLSRVMAAAVRAAEERIEKKARVNKTKK